MDDLEQTYGVSGEWCQSSSGLWHWWDFATGVVCGHIEPPERMSLGPTSPLFCRQSYTKLCQASLRYVTRTRCDIFSRIQIREPTYYYQPVLPWPNNEGDHFTKTKWPCPTCKKPTTLWNYPGFPIERDFCSASCWTIACLQPGAMLYDPLDEWKGERD